MASAGAFLYNYAAGFYIQNIVEKILKIVLTMAGDFANIIVAAVLALLFFCALTAWRGIEAVITRRS